jgi:hypothetical protein
MCNGPVSNVSSWLAATVAWLAAGIGKFAEVGKIRWLVEFAP